MLTIVETGADGKFGSIKQTDEQRAQTPLVPASSSLLTDEAGLIMTNRDRRLSQTVLQDYFHGILLPIEFGKELRR